MGKSSAALVWGVFGILFVIIGFIVGIGVYMHKYVGPNSVVLSIAIAGILGVVLFVAAIFGGITALLNNRDKHMLASLAQFTYIDALGDGYRDQSRSGGGSGGARLVEPERSLLPPPNEMDFYAMIEQLAPLGDARDQF